MGETMAEVTAKLIQELREKTSAGMMDCKKALVENNGDIEAAADWLRQKGIVKAASKASRVAASGLVTVVKCDNMGCVVEVNAETDFVAKNDKFQKLVADVASKAMELAGDFDATLAAVKDDIAATISTIGENMNLRRIAKVNGEHVYIFTMRWSQVWVKSVLQLQSTVETNTLMKSVQKLLCTSQQTNLNL